MNLGASTLSEAPLSTFPGVAAPVVVPELSWEAHFPSPAPQLEPHNTLKTAAMFAVFALANLAIPELSWKPCYPDRQPTPFVVQAKQQSIAFVQVVAAAVTPELSWAAVYPDRQPPPFVIQAKQQSVAYVIPLANLAVPGLGWRTTYPDAQPTPFVVQAKKQASSAFVQLVALTPLSWSPVYPGRGFEAEPVKTRPQFYSTFRIFPGYLPEKQFNAFTTYPDPRPIPLPRQDVGPAFVQVVVVAPTTTFPDWLAVYPNRSVITGKPSLEASPFLAPLAQQAVPELSWSGWRPYARPEFTPNHQGFCVLSSFPFDFAPLLAWQPTYPNPRPEFIPNHAGIYVRGIDKFDFAPELSWQGVYPLPRIPGPARQIDQAAFVQLVQAPTFFNLDWLVQGPFVRAIPLPVQHVEQFLIPLANLAVPSLSWAASYPDPKLIVPQHVATQPAFVVVVVTAAVPDLSWAATYPQPRLIVSRGVSELYAYPLVDSAAVAVSKLIFVSSSFGTLVIIGSIKPVP